MKKVCKKCGRLLDVSNFTKSKNVKDGYENSCKECRNKARKKYIRTCVVCGKEFKSVKKDAKYCGTDCKPQTRQNRIKVNCFICGKEKEITPYQYKHHNHFYCSEKCKNKGYSIVYKGDNHPLYNRYEVKCEICGKILSRNLYEIKRYNHRYCSDKCRDKGWSKFYSGKNNPHWNPDKTNKEREDDRKYFEYSQWRDNVFERDNYTCQCCGDNKGHNLNAHHIYNYSEHKELRLDISNGITLCGTCHKEFHDIYGYKHNNKEQLKEFLNIYKQIKAI